MKHILSYFFVILSTCTPRISAAGTPDVPEVLKFVEFGTSTEVSIPKDDSEKRPETKNTTGIRFAGTVLESRLYIDSSANNNSIRWGLSGTIPTESFSCTIKTGMTNFTGALSRLKNPAPTTSINPLRTSFSAEPGYRTQLPSRTGSSQPEALTILINSGSVSGIPVTLQGSATQNNTFFFSAGSTFPVSSTGRIKTAVTAGNFFLSNNSSLLEKKRLTTAPRLYKAGTADIALITPSLKAFFSCGLHETQWTNCAIWYSGNIRITGARLQLTMTFFSIPLAHTAPPESPLFGIDGSICRTITQAGFTPQIAAGPCKFGIQALASQKITATMTPHSIITAKIAGAVSTDLNSVTIRADAGAMEIPIKAAAPSQSQFPRKYYELSLSTKITGTLFQGNTKLSTEYYPQTTAKNTAKQVYQFSCSAGKGKTERLTGHADYAITVKNGNRTTGNCAASVQLQIRHNNIHYIVKCGINRRF